MPDKASSNQTTYFWADKIPKPLAPYLYERPGPMNVLDVGCGEGGFLFALSKLPIWDEIPEAWGVDLSDRHLESTRKVSPKIKALKCDAQTLPGVPDAHFGLVAASMVIEHVDDDSEMLKSLYRVAAPGGTVYLSTVCKKPYAWYYRKNKQGQAVLDPEHVREYAFDSDLPGQCRKLGFKVENEAKTPLSYPLCDFILHRLKVGKAEIYESPLMALLRKLQIPIPGYYVWELVLKKD